MAHKVLLLLPLSLSLTHSAPDGPHTCPACSGFWVLHSAVALSGIFFPQMLFWSVPSSPSGLIKIYFP